MSEMISVCEALKSPAVLIETVVLVQYGCNQGRAHARSLLARPV